MRKGISISPKFFIICFAILYVNPNSGISGELPNPFYLEENAEGVILIKGSSESSYFICDDVADMNNDGFDDIVVRGLVGNYSGIIYIIYGSQDMLSVYDLNLDGSHSASIAIEDYVCRFVRMGDIDGNGLKDFIIHGAKRPEGLTIDNKIFILPGRPSWLGETYISENDMKKVINMVSRSNGISVLSENSLKIDDINGDRLDDIAFIGSRPNPVHWGTSTSNKLIYVVYGNRELPAELNVEDTDYPVTKILYDTSYSGIGYSDHLGMGDFDGDGKQDAIFEYALPNTFFYGMTQDKDSLYFGTTQIVYGNLFTGPQYISNILDTRDRLNGIAFLTTNPFYRVAKEDEISNIRQAVSAGDINGDGYDDPVISYYALQEGQKTVSRMYLPYGIDDFIYSENLDNRKTNIMRLDGGGNEGTHFAYADVNGDGYQDMLIGCGGNYYYILYGSDSFPATIDIKSDTGLVSTVTGAKLAAAGDINGDGYMDIAGNVGDYGNTIFVLLGRGPVLNEGEQIIKRLSADHESKYTFDFADRTRFQFSFVMGRPFENSELILANYGRILPDSLGDIPSGDGVVSFFNTELTNMGSSYRLNCSFGYTDSSVNALGIKETDLSVSYWDKAKNQWARVTVERDTVLNRVSFTTDHLSLWALVDINDPVVASVDEGENRSIPQTFELFQNYPNPFNPITTIRYQVAGRAEVSLKIYNILGQEIRTLVNGPVAEGNYEIQWDGTDNIGMPVSSGIYLYRLTTDAGFMSARKLVFLK